MAATATTDHTALRQALVRDLADRLRTLTPGEWERPSRCDGWREKDVVGHMVSGTENGLGKLPIKLALAGFDLDKAAARLAVETADSRPPEQLLEDWVRGETAAKLSGFAKTLKPRDMFVDHVVHGVDMLLPLGYDRPNDPERLRAALEAAPEVAGGVRAKKRSQGLRLVATDLDWTNGGAGAEVRGPGEAILLALTGRWVRGDELVGDGVAVLHQRQSA
jgi:uncharacterized protein (TIGR03083 family)